MANIISSIGEFLTSIAGNATMLGICAVMIAGVIGKRAVGIIKKVTH